jgi:hypothetical protein
MEHGKRSIGQGNSEEAGAGTGLRLQSVSVEGTVLNQQDLDKQKGTWLLTKCLLFLMVELIRIELTTS